MYKLLIVDDEKMTRDGMQRIMDWEQYGVSVAGTAINGKEGIKNSKELQPDIILTDIRMKGMDGLSMIEELRQEGFEGAFIIMSGYNLFEYAKRAMSNGINYYLLKPVDKTELESAVTKTICELNTKKDTKLVKKMDLFRSITDELMDDVNFSEDIIPLKGELVFADIKCDSIIIKHSGDRLFVYKQVLEAIGEVYLVFKSNSIMTCLLPYDAVWKLQRLEDVLNTKIKAGVSRKFKGMDEIKQASFEAEIAMENALYHDEKSVVLEYNDSMNKRIDGYFDIIEKNIVSAAEIGDFQMVKDAMVEALEYAAENKYLSTDVIRWSETLFGRVCRLTAKSYPGLQACAEKYIEKSDHRSGHRAHDVKRLLCEFMDICIEEEKNDHIDYNTKAILKVIQYIDEHYTKDISLKQMSKEVFINVSYLSRLFKSYTQKNYIDYITDKRMEKAKELLCNPDLMIYEIGSMLGYQDTKYFSNLFKKTVKMTPREYRINVLGK